MAFGRVEISKRRKYNIYNIVKSQNITKIMPYIKVRTSNRLWWTLKNLHRFNRTTAINMEWPCIENGRKPITQKLVFSHLVSYFQTRIINLKDLLLFYHDHALLYSWGLYLLSLLLRITRLLVLTPRVILLSYSA